MELYLGTKRQICPQTRNDEGEGPEKVWLPWAIDYENYNTLFWTYFFPIANLYSDQALLFHFIIIIGIILKVIFHLLVITKC